jgi:capsular exopolysaccharide synthesis family protein
LNCVNLARDPWQFLMSSAHTQSMSVRLSQQIPQIDSGEVVPYTIGRSGAGAAGIGGADDAGVPWSRYFDALRRHLLLIVAIVAAGTAVGMFAAKRVKPVYDVQSTVWIAAGSSNQSGPIRPQQLLPPTSWVELLRSYSIVEPVVRSLRLNISLQQPGDSIYFVGFESLPSLHPGRYVLKVAPGGRYSLATSEGVVVERGVAGDSIGRKVGFGWSPDARLFQAARTVAFSVSTPRSTAIGLLASLRSSLPDDGQFLTITLSGSNPEQAARTLNAWVDQFVAASGDLQKRHLLEFKQILAEQLGVAERQLRDSETQLEQFRVNTITLPAGGAGDQGVDPSVAGYYQERSALTEVQNERIALEQMVADARGAPINPQSFLTLPAILNNAPQLRAAIDELSSRQAALRTEKQFLTDANPRIKQLAETVRLLEYETIPGIVQNVLQSLRTRERNISGHVASQTTEMKAIPARMIEQTRLTRQVAASENLYSALKSRYEEVSLAEAQATPDLSVLDYAVPASFPNSNDAPRLMLLAILASIAIAGAIALFHDRIDRRFRYPEQVTHELGLTIAGTVPKLRPSRSGDFQVELLSQVVESFRTLRLALRYEFPPNAPIVLAVSSPSASDGKSLISSNLAIAFASAGHRTLLIDGDVRRGTLHTTFDITVNPGLVEYLSNGTDASAVIRSTSTENLSVLPRGTRSNRAPELLVSEKMNSLIQMARQQYDVVIIDSPPFIAGVDAYAVAAAAGNVLVVLRQGFSDRKLAAAKLGTVDRLPIRILGAVINGVPNGGLYRYYGSDYSQGGVATSAGGNLATPRGLVASV